MRPSISLAVILWDVSDPTLGLLGPAGYSVMNTFGVGTNKADRISAACEVMSPHHESSLIGLTHLGYSPLRFVQKHTHAPAGGGCYIQRGNQD